MGKGLIPIILSVDIDGCESFKRLDTGQLVDRRDFEILKELPVFYIKPADTIPQHGAYAHYSSEDYCRMPKEANAVLLSIRKLLQNDIEIFAGQYCKLQEKPDDGIRRLIKNQ